MRLGEMRRHPSYTYLRSAPKNDTEKMMNDKTKLVKEAKTTKQVVVIGPPIKNIRQNGIRRNAIRRNATKPF